MPPAPTKKRIPLVPALEAFRQVRADQIVVTTMGAAREWHKLSQHPLDLNYFPSSMGQAPSIALGLALAQPKREIVLFNGDGSLLMNLGCLVTIVAAGVKNLTVIVVDNGVYEVTGGQQTAGAQAGVDFCGMARAAGFATIARFDDLADWQHGVAAALEAPGPRFIVLATETVRDDFYVFVPGPIGERLERFVRGLKG